MKKRAILNICMVVTVILVAVCGVMAVGSVKGWFEREEEGMLTVLGKSGIAMVERNGVAYEVSEGTIVREADILYTQKAATLQLGDVKRTRISLEGNAEISITEMKEGLELEVLQGDALIDAREMSNVTVLSNGKQVQVEDAVLSVSTQAGASMVYVYAGKASLAGIEETITIEAGQVATVVKNVAEPEINGFAANSLSDAQITQLMECGMDDTFCFLQVDLEKVRAEREEEKLRVQQELLAKKEASGNTDETQASEENEAGASSGDTTGAGPQQDTTQGDTGSGDNTAANSGQEDNETESVIPEQEESKQEDTSLHCTIEIRCDSILNNMANLASGKEGYVPSNGIILGTTQVAFEEGETVFDVLQRVCNSIGIQLEYSYTPLYESYYIEGLNYLYEFDCGSESGWMYKVNGWFPNYGCSSYYVQEGDIIVWCYTCNGLGADVGGDM